MILLSIRPAGLSLVTEMLAVKRDQQGVVNYRLLTNHAKVWAAARSHDINCLDPSNNSEISTVCTPCHLHLQTGGSLVSQTAMLSNWLTVCVCEFVHIRLPFRLHRGIN